MMFNHYADEDYLDFDDDENSDQNSSESSDDDISIVVRHPGNRYQKTTYSKPKLKNNPKKVASDFEEEMENELSERVEALRKHFSLSETRRDSPKTTTTTTDTTTTTTTTDTTTTTTDVQMAETSGIATDTSSTVARGKKRQLYSDVYFDSDDEDNADGSTNNKHQVMSDDELFYDPNMDAKDQLWMDERRRNPHRPVSVLPPPRNNKQDKNYNNKRKQGNNNADKEKGSSNNDNNNNNSNDPTCPDNTSKKRKPKGNRNDSRKAPSSDALLDCPACMTTICIDCQRHAKYPNQYRAMFVMNCTVDYSEELTYNTGSDKKSKKKKSDSTGEIQEVYHPVHCNECKLQVAVYDKDEIYHFFNVISSYG